MAIQDVITLLGKKVTFLQYPRYLGVPNELQLMVTGHVEAVIIHQHMFETEILVDGDYYSMATLKFIDLLPNPIEVS
ncbi:hypothetical protein IOD06_00500 [Psychrobacter sp. N25K4-3-2]|jgi:hypothetical protein|uniref:hypothetical protein n=1 Tax=Psychrobacter sp. N25K4-3-2 TaxID=2785026 RepID=UPI00188B0ABE|nr:hypothetical protein [Psychrobacter sp. N25K4-3-2]MBF4488368.1 hypothetical protein [Psychrobacter sp. N25K4-3-2]